MNWHPGQTREGNADPYFMASDPKGYTIAKVFVMGQLLYEAWHMREMLATRLPSADAARTVCNKEAGA